jgi:hypothetical protein
MREVHIARHMVVSSKNNGIAERDGRISAYEVTGLPSNLVIQQSEDMECSIRGRWEEMKEGKTTGHLRRGQHQYLTSVPS